MAAKSFKRRSARAPSDHERGHLVSQRLLPDYGKFRPQPYRKNDFPKVGGGGSDSGARLSLVLMSDERRVLRSSLHYLFWARVVTVVIDRTAWISTARVMILLRVG